LPSVAGSERLEEELQECIQAVVDKTVVGVSVCWDYFQHQGKVHQALLKSLDRQDRAGSAARRVPQPQQDFGPLRRTLMRLESSLLVEEEEKMSDDELRDMVHDVRCCSKAFAVFLTEVDRDQAMATLADGLAFRGERLAVSVPHHEPHSVNWNNMDCLGFTRKVQRLARGLLLILLAVLLYLGVFYAPYAWSILNFNYDGGQQPGMVYTIAFSLIVCAGNLLMAQMAGQVADSLCFEYQENRERCYMVIYLMSIVVNVGFDMWTTYFMATQIMIGLDFRTEDGRLLSKVDDFLGRFESYALQRSMGQQLYEYAFPSTFIVPFLAEPVAVIFLFLRVFMLLIRSHPELQKWQCRGWLASVPFDLGRYADILVNVFLAVLVFFFPGGYTHWIFGLLAACHVYIYALDHYRVLRVVPRVIFHSGLVDQCAQAMLAPACAVLLVCIIFKGNCSRNFAYCWEPDTLFVACSAAFGLHTAVHLLILEFAVPRYVEATRMDRQYRKDAKTYSQVAREEPCSWFTSNPMHCLRSMIVYKHSPPCSYYIPGMAHTMKVNDSIGCHFSEVESCVEEAQTYMQLPALYDISGLFASDLPDTDTNIGDTGAT